MFATFKFTLVHFFPNEFDEGVFPRVVRSSPRAVVRESPKMPHASLSMDAIHTFLLSSSQMLSALEVSSSKLRPLPRYNRMRAFVSAEPSMQTARKVLCIWPQANEQAAMNELKMAESSYTSH